VAAAPFADEATSYEIQRLAVDSLFNGRERLGASLPARVMSEIDLAELFRQNPDAWVAFFRENVGAAGLVELSPVHLSPDGRRATTYVGRSCGEHCRNAWRIEATRAAGRWTIAELQWVRVPGA
jgi:hypothetical protein